MPRGLGDDPLSRQRKNAVAKRSGASTASVASPPDDDSSAPSSTAQPSVQNIAEASSSSPASMSSTYNDVFWRKRAEPISTASDAVIAQQAPAGEAAPIAVTAAPMELPVPQEQRVAEIAAPAEPLPAVAAAPESPALAAVQSPAPVEAQPEPHKGGFFSRIFGKIRT